MKCKGKKKVIVSAATSSIKELDEAPSVNIQSGNSLKLLLSTAVLMFSTRFAKRQVY